MSKQKNAVRTLAILVGEIRKTLRNDIANIIKRGELLQEAKDQLEYGKWLPWLEENFDMDERTAQRAMAVAKFASKYDSLSDLHLTKSALYELSSGDYPERVINAALKEAESKQVNDSRLYEINEELNPEPEPEPVEDLPETDEQAEAEAEAEDIFDGPPLDLPPSADPPSPTDFTLAQFDKAIKSLAESHTKSVSKFVGTTHGANDLRKIADFLCAIADFADTVEGDRGKTLRRVGTDSWAPVEEGASA
jgi:hypothetical protein